MHVACVLHGGLRLWCRVANAFHWVLRTWCRVAIVFIQFEVFSFVDFGKCPSACTFLALVCTSKDNYDFASHVNAF